MKINQRLDYNRLADALSERDLVEAGTLAHALEQSQQSGVLLPEILVTENLVSDWDLSRVSCEIFNLPFLPVEVYEPSEEALAQLDPEFLRRFCLVPLDRFDKLLTVAMPAMVPAEVLSHLGRHGGVYVLPVVSLVTANRRWLEDKLPAPAQASPAAALPGQAVGEGGAWADMFDAADAAVQLDLSGAELDPDLELGD